VSSFQDMLVADYNWRLGEIAIIKALTVQTGLTDEKRAVSRKYAVPSLYSVWEGFITSSFAEYVRAINNKKLSCDLIHDNIFVYYIFARYPQLREPPSGIEKRKVFLENLRKDLMGVVCLPMEIDVSSNVNYKQLIRLFNRYGVSAVGLEKYEQTLNKFVGGYRVKIAHGDNSIFVDDAHIEEFSKLIISLMSDIIEIMSSHCSDEAFCKKIVRFDNGDTFAPL